MTQNALVSKGDHGQIIVTAYKEFCCPACGRVLFETQLPLALKIICSRCQGMWKVEGGKSVMLRIPKHVSGKMKGDIEKLYKK